MNTLSPSNGIGGASGVRISRNLSRSDSADAKSAWSNSYNAWTSAERRRLGLRSMHALVLQRGVQYFRVALVFGNVDPQCPQVPISLPPPPHHINRYATLCVHIVQKHVAATPESMQRIRMR